MVRKTGSWPQSFNPTNERIDRTEICLDTIVPTAVIGSKWFPVAVTVCPSAGRIGRTKMHDDGVAYGRMGPWKFIAIIG